MLCWCCFFCLRHASEQQRRKSHRASVAAWLFCFLVGATLFVIHLCWVCCWSTCSIRLLLLRWRRSSRSSHTTLLGGGPPKTAISSPISVSSSSSCREDWWGSWSSAGASRAFYWRGWC